MLKDAIVPTLCMLGVLTIASMAVFSVAVLAPEIAPQIGVAGTWVGAFMALTYVTAMLTGALTGDFTRRYGPVRVCQLSMLAAAAGLAALTPATLASAAAAALLLGSAYGTFNPASAEILGDLATARWRPLVFSIKQTGVPLGGVLAGALLPPAATAFGWRTAIAGVAVAALLVASAIAPQRSRFDANPQRSERLRLQILGPVRLVLSDPVLRRYSLAAFAFAGCQVSVGAYTVLYLHEAIGMSLVRAGAVFACLQAGGFAGRPLWGAIAGHATRPGAVLGWLGWLVAVFLIAMLAVEPSWPVSGIIAISILLGATAFGWNGVMLAEIAAHAPRGEQARATAGLQFIMFANVVLLPSGFGWVVAQGGGYGVAFGLLACVAAAGALLVARREESP